MGSNKSQIERLLDIGLFAPLGFALQRERTIDDLATVGRKQLAFSRSLGRAALAGIARSAQTGPTGKPQPVDAASTAQIPGSDLVDGYGDMTARSLIGFVATCTDEQAAAIRTAEVDGKSRVTVLRALDARG